MPLELGIFIGCHQFSHKSSHNKDKKTLIMDIEGYRYRNFISDLSGQDIKSHSFEPELAVQNVRDFLFNNSRLKSIAGSSFIFVRYIRFTKDLPVICSGLFKDIHKLTFNEFSDIATGWISSNPLN